MIQWRALILICSVFLFSTPLGQTRGLVERNIMELQDQDDATSKIDRALIISQHPLSHLIFNKDNVISDISALDKIPKEQRLRRAIEELSSALENSSKIKGYSVGQVYSFLGYSYTQLGIELYRHEEKSTPSKKKELKIESDQSFQKGIESYRLAISNSSNDLKYKTAVDLIQAIIASGDLNRALDEIESLSQQRISPPPKNDHALIRMKADIYWIRGMELESALTYEEWINQANTESQIRRGSTLYERLIYLKMKTKHLQNLPNK